MPVVYQPEWPHECRYPSGSRPVGTIYQCGGCGQFYLWRGALLSTAETWCRLSARRARRRLRRAGVATADQDWV